MIGVLNARAHLASFVSENGGDDLDSVVFYVTISEYKNIND